MQAEKVTLKNSFIGNIILHIKEKIFWRNILTKKNSYHSKSPITIILVLHLSSLKD